MMFRFRCRAAPLMPCAVDAASGGRAQARGARRVDAPLFAILLSDMRAMLDMPMLWRVICRYAEPILRHYAVFAPDAAA